MISRSSRGRYSQNSNCPPGWMWLLAGLLIGMFLSFLIYLREIDSTVPPDTQAKNTPIVEKPVETKPPSPIPHFEFYDILPQSEVSSPAVAVSETEVTEVDVVAPPPAKKTEVIPVEKTVPPPVQSTASAQILQVGAFRDVQEAEGLKAHLAMLGIRSQVRATSEEGVGVWHRVEVGPIKNFAQLERLQAQLRTHNIAFILQPAN